MRVARCLMRPLIGALLAILGAAPVAAHPGSGIVVDDDGRVWFMDTGFGLWQIDAGGRLTAEGGPAGHFLAFDPGSRFQHDHLSSLRAGDLEIARLDPTLIVGREYPMAVGSDGALYFPQVAGKGRVRLMRMEPGQAAKPFADLPPMRESGYDGNPVDVEWIWGIAAGPAGSLYYTERQAVRRVAPDGTVSTLAEKIVVPDCERPEGLKQLNAENGLYGLAVAADGTVYVASPVCSAVLKITPAGDVSVVLRATDRWSPQGVAIHSGSVYVLEYDYVASDDRADWLPRVRRLDADGTVTILAAVEERPERADSDARRPRPLVRSLARGLTLPARAHAAFVHFPIVLFAISVPVAVWALVARARIAPRVQLLVIFVALIVACGLGEWTGEAAERRVPFGPDSVPGITWEVIHAHTYYAERLSTIAWVGVALAGVSLLRWPARWAAPIRIGAVALALVAALYGSATAIVTAHYGGELVYGQGLGSETLQLYLEEKARTKDAVSRLTASLETDESQKPAADPFAGDKPGAQHEIQKMQLCWCPAGRFTFGSPRSEPERRPGETQVTVTLSNGFWMGKYEVTQADWKRIVGKLPGPATAELPEQDDLPVGNVNFAEAEGFCKKLTELARAADEIPEGWEFRLPTEAQWEYACRAGTTTATSFGDTIDSKQANIKGSPAYNGAEAGPTLGKAAPVGSYPANPWGLHDLHGNTCEWCRDWFHIRYPGGVDPDLHDAQATATKNDSGDYSRSRRGSCWCDPGWPSRSAFRQRFEPERRYDHIGFRVVLVPTG